MGETGAKKVETTFTNKVITELKCNDCELIVRLISDEKLSEAHRDELQARIVCVPCEKKRINAKK